MRRTRPGVLACLGTVVAATLATLPPAAASAATAAGSGRHVPQQGASPCRRSRPTDVVDSYGVGVHLNFLDTPYLDYGRVATALEDLGVRHVRDDLYVNTGTAARQHLAIADVARRAGVKFDLIMRPPTQDATPAQYVHAVSQLPAGAVDGLEGVNEWDRSGDGWAGQLRAWQQQLSDAAAAEPATAGLPVLAPALGDPRNYAALGDLSSWATTANAHIYPDGYRPSNLIGAISAAARGTVPAPAPFVATEAGYHNATNASSGVQKAVPEDVAGVYMPRLLLEHVRRGEQRMYGYELVDEFLDPAKTNPEAHFGLLRHDWSPKPAYTAMKNLLGLLSDPGPAFEPGSLPVIVDGWPSDARVVTTQKRDGDFVLLLWRDEPLWDPVTRQRETVTPQDVTLRFGEAHELSVYHPSAGAGPDSVATGDAVTVPLDGQVTALEVGPALPPAPARVTAAGGDRAATVSWRLPATPEPVTGFEVTREPGHVVARVAAGARSFTDSGLRNGRRYTFSVRTLGLAGSRSVASPAVEGRPVVPATVPGAPTVVSVVPAARSVTLTWRGAAPHGRRVTAYRLRVGHRVVLVRAAAERTGGGRYAATVRGLPARSRLVVGVRARNAVGRGAPAHVRFATRG